MLLLRSSWDLFFTITYPRARGLRILLTTDSTSSSPPGLMRSTLVRTPDRQSVVQADKRRICSQYYAIFVALEGTSIIESDCLITVKGKQNKEKQYNAEQCKAEGVCWVLISPMVLAPRGSTF